MNPPQSSRPNVGQAVPSSSRQADADLIEMFESLTYPWPEWAARIWLRYVAAKHRADDDDVDVWIPSRASTDFRQRAMCGFRFGPYGLSRAIGLSVTICRRLLIGRLDQQVIEDP